MMHLGPDSELPDNLDAPGGFAWWYVDAVDADGNGMVCIWAWGLPFLPGMRAHPTPARLRPSVNLALYEGGRCVYFLLQELRPDEATRDGAETDAQSWTFGPNRFRSTRSGGRLALEGHLDLPVPGSRARLRGGFTLEGVHPTWGFHGDTHVPHRWTPLCLPASATVDLATDDGFAFALKGRGYHDRNQSTVPLTAIGARSWSWGRVAQPDAEVVHYLLEPDIAIQGAEGARPLRNASPERGGRGPLHPSAAAPEAGRPLHLALRVGLDGTTHVGEAPDADLTAPRRDLYGVPWHGHVQVGADRVRYLDPVESGPFYLRHPLLDPETGARGWGERVVPARIDVPWQRPLVRMRVHGPDPRHDSAWLPIFSGPTTGRVERLVRSWTGTS